jgi:hypothetical protein
MFNQCRYVLHTIGFKGVHVLAIVPKSPSFPSRVTKMLSVLTENTFVKQNLE